MSSFTLSHNSETGIYIQELICPQAALSLTDIDGLLLLSLSFEGNKAAANTADAKSVSEK